MIALPPILFPFQGHKGDGKGRTLREGPLNVVLEDVVGFGSGREPLLARLAFDPLSASLPGVPLISGEGKRPTVLRVYLERVLSIEGGDCVF